MSSKNKATFVVANIIGTLFLTAILEAIDFLYAGVQEKFLTNINPSYIPNLSLANKVIIACSLTATGALVAYLLLTFFLIRREKIDQQLKDEKILDQTDSLNFQKFQREIGSSIEVLKDLFLFQILIVILSGLFSFLKFLWTFSKYRSYTQLFIEYYLSNVASILVSLSIYLVLAFMMNYLIISALQKYIRLKIISEKYQKAMAKVLQNFDKLLAEEQTAQEKK
ncbi:MAG: hypothetical protein K9W42_06715 [Candidatus Heimdallarchaeota archaeon]|nr:hypothetical protein [Candidatus Heimdallarchaeota archaeon]